LAIHTAATRTKANEIYNPGKIQPALDQASAPPSAQLGTEGQQHGPVQLAGQLRTLTGAPIHKGFCL